MTYKTYDCNSYRIHTIKTDKFKTCHLEIIFRKKAQKEDLAKDALLADVLMETSKMYPTRQEFMARLEELYRATFFGMTTKVGNLLFTNFIFEFINPEFITEENYLNEALKFPFAVIENPNAINSEFDLKTFKLCQKRCLLDIKSVIEDTLRLSIKKTLSLLNTPTGYDLLGSEEEMADITPSSLYDHYQKLFKENECDIFLIGNLDMDQAVSIIKQNFHKRIINHLKLTIPVANEIRKKALSQTAKGDFVQTNLNILYNLVNLTPYEKDIVFNVYNYILGNGGITSKLYQEIREKKSYCYAISSMYLKHDNLLLIHVGLDKENEKDTLKLIKKIIAAMAAGKFSDEELQDAKTNLEMSLNLSLDNQVAILNNYAFKVFANLPSLEERIKQLKAVTREDVIKVAQKLKLNLTFVLEGK